MKAGEKYYHVSDNRQMKDKIRSFLWYIFRNLKASLSVYYENGFEINIVSGRLDNLSIGEHSYGKIRLTSYGKKISISIGSYTSISEISIIIGGNHHMDNTTYPFRTFFLDYPIEEDNSPPFGVTIGHDVWIGYGAIILDGANIGTGAIIGAGAVIRGNVPPYAVVIGNPGTITKYRFNQREIEMLINSEWWKLTKEELLKIENLLYSRDVETFVLKVQELKNSV